MTQPSSRTTPDLTQISEDAWSKARKRLTAIQPLLTAEPISKEVAKQYAETAGVHVSTLYRWLEGYRQTEQTYGAIPWKGPIRVRNWNRSSMPAAKAFDGGWPLRESQQFWLVAPIM